MMIGAAAKRFDDVMESTPRMHEDSEKMSAKGSGKEARPAGFEPATLGSEELCSCPLIYGLFFRTMGCGG